MSLRKVGEFNDISPELMPKLPPKGTVVVYKSTNEIPDPIPDSMGRKKTNYPFQVKIPPFSSFYDTKKEAWVRIGLLSGVDNNGYPTGIKRHYAHFQKQAGCFSLVVGQNSDVDALYQYLELASFVKRGEDVQRDDNETVIMERIDSEGDAAKKRVDRDNRYEAVKKAKELQGEDFKKACLVLGYYNPSVKENEQREQVEAFAEANPDSFMSRVYDSSADAIAAINLAIHLGTVKIDADQAKWADSGGTLFQVNGGDVAKSFLSVVEKSKNGAALLESVVDANKKFKKK